MKKIILVIISLFTLCKFSEAQFKQVAAGPQFDEPQKGISKLVLMKDGSVVFFTITPKEGIDLRIYNKEHKETISTNIRPAYGNLKAPVLEEAFEINGEVVLLLSEIQDKIPVLYRIIIEGTSGKLKNEEKIAELKRVNLGQGYAMIFGNVNSPGFYVSKDPDSDNYATVLFNSFESDRNKRIEIVHYNSVHKEISRGYYSSPDEKYKYLDFISMAVMGSEKVSVLVSGFNTPAHGGRDKEVILANLEKGTSTVSFTELNFPKDSILEKGLVRYNPVTKKFIVIAKIYANKNSKEADMFIAFVNPYTGKMDKLTKTGLSQKIVDKGIDLYGKKYKYTGTPVNLYISPSGSFSVAYEPTIITGTMGSSAYAGGSSSYAETQAIVMMSYNKDGEIMNDYMVPKSFMVDNSAYVMRSISFRNEYKKFAFINCGEKRYVFINDSDRNIERIEKDQQPIMIQGVDECDVFYFPLTGNDAIPQRLYLFGKQDSKRDHVRALLELSAYDRQNDLFIVTRFQKEGKNKGVNLVWLRPQ